ncbi:MAG: 4-alpha-glucanotransferase [Pseudohongiella sp.]|nr:4-alpha-glucanotransferase [Pseudohongiella sp.]MDO9519688.1 4-alpha-glucanotransferase [Pseudohongiella sp.]MDP2128254.1 4-alpha-glucanotransferase [Pseudohongiella sp.]
MTDTRRPSLTPAEEELNRLFAQLLSACGIQDRFTNYSGATELISLQDLLAVLSAQGCDVSNTTQQIDVDAIHEQLRILHKTRETSLLPPVVVFTRRSDLDEYVIHLNVPENLLTGQLSWHTTSEEGQQSSTVKMPFALLTETKREFVDGAVYCQISLPLPLSNLPAGYHQLTVSILATACGSPAVEQTIPLILAPARCYEPAWSADGKKLWGFSVQLYSFCTERSWGMGDFLDLSNLIEKSAAQGASYLVLNPLHAGPLNQPEYCSPYSPVDRRRLNPLYIAPELEPEFTSGKASTWLANSRIAEELLTTVRTSEWIDYPCVAELKIRVLALMFSELTNNGKAERKTAFEEFKNRKGPALHEYARWQAEQGCNTAGEYSDSVEFYIYLQWLAETQLEACQQRAVDLGMSVGLIRDLAVGSDRKGAEVSLSRGVFSIAASIGAPPDPLAPQGQNWGLPPLNPVKLRGEGYAHFIDLLRSNMEHSGALRIDHVMSLMRLWWCPYETSGQGAYVMYPAEDLFAILRLESQRQQCLVIGEDLGIVPQEVRRHLNESGIYSNLLFYFEKASADMYRSPQQYAPRSLAMLANHDVPTLAAWWNGYDLQLRRSLQLIENDNELTHQLNYRQVEKKQILQLLESQWLLPADRFAPDQLEKDMDITLASALMRCIARSGAMLVSVQLEDLVLLKLPVNIPGTSTEYKNWQRKMPSDLLTILDTESVRPMLESLRVERHQ